jgi:hypothetical protein
MTEASQEMDRQNLQIGQNFSLRTEKASDFTPLAKSFLCGECHVPKYRISGFPGPQEQCKW